MPRVGVAVSGGGYRAAAWGLGVLWCLSDVGLAADVSTVSSVSGGSLTNAYDGLRRGADEPERTAFAQRLAGRPGAFRAALLVSVVAALAAAVTARVAPAVSLGCAVVVLLAAVAGAARSGDLLFGRWVMWLYVDTVLLAPAVAVRAWSCWWVVAAALPFWLLLRGPVVGWCLGRSLQRLAGAPRALLADLSPVPERVILATDLHAGHHACFGRDFVYCYDFGFGAKASLRVRTAVQASANLPGAFPTRWLSTRGMGLVGAPKRAWFALTDGGVYDNMADQWQVGYGRRVQGWAAPAFDRYRATIDRVAATRPDFVVVANASASLRWRATWKAAIPVAGELLGLLQVKDVLYDNGTSVRREWLVGRFDKGNPSGTLVHIATSPYAFADWAATRPELAERAAAAIAWLDGLGLTRGEWESRMDDARRVGTQLWPVGDAPVANLVDAAYAQAAANLHVRLGVPLPAGLPYST